MTTPTRPGWDYYFMIIADAASLRASCDRARVGTVIVSPDHRILSTVNVRTPQKN